MNEAKLYNTMRLTSAPGEGYTTLTKFWNALFDAYGFDTFHPMEGRGVLRATHALQRLSAVRALETLVSHGFAISP